MRTVKMPADWPRQDLFDHYYSFEPHTRRHFRSQLLLHRFKLRATGVAELPQRVFAVHRARLYLLGSEIRLRISGHNGFYDLLSLCQNPEFMDGISTLLPRLWCASDRHLEPRIDRNLRLEK